MKCHFNEIIKYISKLFWVKYFSFLFRNPIYICKNVQHFLNQIILQGLITVAISWFDCLPLPRYILSDAQWRENDVIIMNWQEQ